MRKILAFLSILAIMACKEEPKDYATISGKITNPVNDNLMVFKGREYNKDIKLNEDGTFTDTLKVEEGIYTFKHGDEYGQIFLKNDNSINFTLNAKEFDETLKFDGDGADQSNFLIKKSLVEEKHLSDDGIFELPEDEFTAVMDKLKADYESLKTDYPSIEEAFFTETDKQFSMSKNMYSEYYQSKLAIQKEFPTGSPSPAFEKYENYKGGTTSLSDLKGKYVYVDVWATWCGPCKREIPALQELEKEYHGKNIEFVSISVDNGRGYKADTKEEAFKLSKEGWKDMIADKQMGGIQLFADKAWESDFVTGYKITGIPRFILIDPDGNVVNADAPRPSSTSIKELFNSLNI